MNILRVLHQASAEEVLAGLTWYRDSLDHVVSLVRDSHQRGEIPATPKTSRRAIAGMIAALSPQKTWTINVRLVFQVLRTRDGGQYKVQVKKAAAIADGADPLSVLKGPKERAFFECLFDPDHTQAVTVDGHAFSIWMGVRIYVTRVRLSRRLYRIAEGDYQRAAKQVGLRPHQLQAITWLCHRRMHNSLGFIWDKSA
jgi:hypothetical protein